MTLRARLDRLHGIYPRNSTRVDPALDFSRLTIDEALELDDILIKLEGVPPLANGEADLSALSDVERERLDALYERSTVTP